MREIETGKAIANANVKLFFNKKDVVVKTDIKGNYSLPIKASLFPDSFIMAFWAKGYVPVAKNITKENGSGFIMNAALNKESRNAVVLELEPNLHHLGDGKFKGAENSQFQMAAEGKEITISFEMKAEHLFAKTGEITLQAKGLNYDNQLLVNDSLVAVMNESPLDGSFGKLTYKIDTKMLHQGVNSLVIKSTSKNNNWDHDDFETTNVILRLTY